MSGYLDDFQIVLVVMTFLVIVIGGTTSAPIIHAQDGQSQHPICNNGSCYTFICSSHATCQSIQSNRPVASQPMSEEAIVMEPVGTATSHPANEEVILMEPVIMHQPHNDLGPEENEIQDVVESVTVEENHYDDRSNENEDHQEDYEDRISDHADDPAHDRFEQELQGTPEDLEVETGNKGMGIAVDYVIFFSDEQTRVLENPDKQYNGGPLLLQREGTISFSFADCHNVGCVRPEGINSVYLVDENVNDEDIINDAIDDSMKAKFEQTDSESFQFKVPNGITGSNTHNKLVIVTQQTDEIRAFYIHEGVEVS
jgi:hypothetical protein